MHRFRNRSGLLYFFIEIKIKINIYIIFLISEEVQPESLGNMSSGIESGRFGHVFTVFGLGPAPWKLDPLAPLNLEKWEKKGKYTLHSSFKMKNIFPYLRRTIWKGSCYDASVKCTWCAWYALILVSIMLRRTILDHPTR